MAETKSLIKQRGLVKAQITRMFNTLKQAHELEHHMLVLRKQKLEEHYTAFVAVQSQIDVIDDNSEQDITRIDIEELYYECADFINKHLLETDTSVAIRPNISNPPIVPSPSLATADTMLPKIHIQPFDGKFENWHSFSDVFISLVHQNDSIPITHKFHLLKSYLTGSAAGVISSLNATEENYFAAWDAIQNRYNKPRKIIQSHIRALFELPEVARNSASALRSLTETAEMHVNALKMLKESVDCHEILIFLITSKLDRFTRTSWERSIEDGKRPKFEELLAFLHKFCNDSESGDLYTEKPLASNKNSGRTFDKPGHSVPRGRTQNLVSTRAILECPMCKQDHYIQQCPSFLNKSPRDRFEYARTARYCTNCLRKGHSSSQCSSGNCRKCDKKHHTLLHFPQNTQFKTQVENSPNASNTQPTTSVIPVALNTKGNVEILLSTARILILDQNNIGHECRVLLDSGSQSNFITDRLARKLKLTPQKLSFRSASGLGQQSNQLKYQVTATIKSRLGDFTCTSNFLAIPTITEMLPSRPFDSSQIPIPQHINLADPEFYKPAEIDLLLGEYLFYKLTSVGRIRLPNDTAILQKTRLGWIISGNIGDYIKHSDSDETRCYFNSLQLDRDLTKFWEIEEGPVKKYLSDIETRCEDHFTKTIRRDTSGRYVAKLPFNERQVELGESYNVTLRRFYSLERKLELNSPLRIQYNKFLNEYLSLGHMQDISQVANIHEGFYLPHHAVVKDHSVTTKVRVVFDGSAKTNTGLSLNEALMVGPTLQEDLFSILVRFRSHSYVLSADIEKMFRQILIDQQDTKYQKILWRNCKSEPLRTYALNTVTYGTASAPYIAVRCLLQLAIDEGDKYPLAAEAFKNDFYMDDLLTGTDSMAKARKLREELIQLGKLGGFNLTQWSSNEVSLIKDLLDISADKQVHLDTDQSKRTLGLVWHSIRDDINYHIQFKPDPIQYTKRSILSKIAQLFDPLGLLGPLVIRAKIIMQQLWKCNSEWDDIVPDAIRLEWQEYYDELRVLVNLRIPRIIIIKDALNIQLHGFCDASERAYGACIYIRSTDHKNKTIVRLVCAKARVAPLKSITLPRLELCAAHLLSKLFINVTKALKVSFHLIRFWSDSTITLHWLKTSPHKLKTFVANRVAEIQSKTQGRDWCHVNSIHNPADYISRGQGPSELMDNKVWFAGPEWLALDKSHWPNKELPDIQIPEIKTVNLFAQPSNFQLLSRFSSFQTLRRVTAYCLRFINNISRNPRLIGNLSTTELQRAHTCIIKLLQKEAFFTEIAALKTNQDVRKGSSLISLNPFLDSDEILRVGGRLKRAAIPFEQKHPIVLPRGHHVTKLIIKEHHIKYCHTGILATLNAVRQNYWPIDGRNVTRFIVRSCIRCFKTNPTFSAAPIMGDLPRTRIIPNRPFEAVGIDYCGPFFVKEKKFRNTKKLKTYVAVFICFATKAVHLELVDDLTTEAFLASLKRFFARRGRAKHIYSDNATNFVGAKNQMDEISQLLHSRDHNNVVDRHLSEIGIEWHFAPPRSPHFGGLWEAAVKSFKTHLKRTIGDALFTFEQLNTYVIEVEAILNSRPLTPLSPDPNDFQALTPAHFLIGESLQSVPEHDFRDTPINRLSMWQHIERVKQHFWSRWQKDYLHQLTTRTKWRLDPKRHLHVGTLVLIRDDTLPPMQWKLGRVLTTHPGDDDIIRVVTLRTATGTMKRSIQHLCPLPIETDNSI